MPTYPTGTMPCAYDVHYGTLAPLNHYLGRAAGYGWIGYCGRPTANRCRICDDCIASHNEDYPRNRIERDADPWGDVATLNIPTTAREE